MLPTAHQLKVYEAKLKKEAKAAGKKRSAPETGGGGGGGGGGAAAKKANRRALKEDLKKQKAGLGRPADDRAAKRHKPEHDP